MMVGQNRAVWLIGIVVLCVVTASHSLTQQNQEWLTAEGLGATYSEALQDALRLVVEQGVGVWLEARSLMVNMEVKEDIVKTVAKGYVRRYEEIGRTQEGELIRVRIRAKVADVLQGVDERFAEAPALYQQLGEPRVLVLLDEEVLGRPLIGEHPTEFAIIEALLKERVRMVDKAQVEKVRRKEAMRALLKGDKVAAWEIGEEAGAEILLVGTAKADRFGEFFGGELQSCHGRIELKAIWVDDGEILVARRLEKVAASEFLLPTAARMALQKAGQQVVEGGLRGGFLAAMVNAFAFKAAEGRTVCLRLRGSYDDLIKLLDIAKRYRDFVGVIRDDYDEDKGEGRLWARVKGNPTDFIQWLLRQPFGRTRLQVVRKSATGREVTFRLL